MGTRYGDDGEKHGRGVDHGWVWGRQKFSGLGDSSFLNFKTLIQNFVSLKIVHTFCGAPWRVTWSYARDCSTGQTAHSLPISNPIQCEQTVPYL